ncbi:MAG: hypothetical protein HQ485_12980 [Acidobacteria bacterium]|jgi:hypothetical protein|nr:hypothetical protein [Acidobacteriota bacterium]
MVRFAKRHTPTSARPETLVIPPDASEPRLRATLYDSSGVEEREIKDVSELGPLPTNRKLWLNPKVENYPAHTVLVTRHFDWTRGQMPRFSQVAIFVGTDYVLTF